LGRPKESPRIIFDLRGEDVNGVRCVANRKNCLGQPPIEKLPASSAIRAGETPNRSCAPEPISRLIRRGKLTDASIVADSRSIDWPPYRDIPDLASFEAGKTISNDRTRVRVLSVFRLHEKICRLSNSPI